MNVIGFAPSVEDKRATDAAGLVEWLRELADTIESEESPSARVKFAYSMAITDDGEDYDITHSAYNANALEVLGLFAFGSSSEIAAPDE